MAGRSYRTLGQLDRAAAAFGRAVELAPAVPKYRSNLALVLLEQDRLEETRATLAQLRQLAPDWPRSGIQAARDYLAKGKANHRNRREAVLMARLACMALSDPPAEYLEVLRSAHALEAAAGTPSPEKP